MLLLLGCPGAWAEEPGKIRDNSFLLEEAYNQEPGVIQHILSAQYMEGGSWEFTFNDEWPAPRETHQLSATVPASRLRQDGKNTGLGDILFHYRYQLVLKDPAALSPRLHWNPGMTYVPRARGPAGARGDTYAFNCGASAVFLASEALNLLVEAAGESTEAVTGPGTTERGSSFFLNPGIRFAGNREPGLQIVPGVGIPIGIGPSRGEYGVFLYLSLEHALF